MKKRILNLALALCLVLNLCPASALAASAGNGELCLTLHRTGAVAETTFALELQGADGSAVKSASLTAAQGETVSAVSLADIPDGTYTLQIQAEGYLPYTQSLTYDSAQQANCIQLDLYNYVSVNEGAGGHGVMPAGDVNGDGAINDADADAVTAAMGTGETRSDLDGSGTVDLADLTIVVRNQGGCTQAQPVNTISSTRLAQTLTVAATEGTASGSPTADLLDQQKTETRVQLHPAQSAPISEENPVELTLEPKPSAAESSVSAEAIVIAPPAGSASTITAGEVKVETEDGETITVPILPDDAHSASPVSLFSLRSAPTSGVTVESDGTVVINLGRRVAIKKVTIRVTGASQTNLAEIAKVEFLSDFAQRIPEPQLSIPDVLAVTNTESDGQGYKNLTVTWTPQSNVTGYEVSVTGPGYAKTASTSQTSYTFQGDSFNGTVASFKTYTVKVRSVSGDWKSQWSAPYTHTVTCTKVPPRPQYLTAEAGVNSLKVTWNCKFDAETYTLYYKAADEETYLTKPSLTTPSCTLTGLRSGVKYTLYVVAHNRNGDSPKSADAEGIPTSASGVELPKYKLLNTDDGTGMATTHITAISGNANKSYTIHKEDGTTVPNTSATPEDWKALLDGQPNTYLTIPDWDSGVKYGNFRGPILQLDARYTMDTIRMTPFEGSGAHMNAVKVGYRDETGAIQTMNASFYNRYDSQNRRYYEVVLDQPITTDYLEIRTTTSYGATQNYTICEVRLYHYDDLEDRVAALFKDDARTELQPEVTLPQIEALITEAQETTDPVSGEHHPHKATILSDLEYAKGLLEHTATAAFLTVDNQITAKGSPNNGFAQTLSDYQPLGCVAAAGDVVVIYVIDKDGQTAKGANVELKLVATQYHPQVRAWQSSAIQLKAGRNEITIPKIGSDATERGGSLYLQYTGAKGARNYEVRTTGATPIPTLRLDGVTGEDRTKAIKIYADELQRYVAQVESLHTQHHGTDKENASVQYAYDEKNCFLNATEITMDNMMYSLPATQVWSAISADPAGKLENSIAAMEQEIDYFYQFKGLHPQAEGPDAYPYTRLNIRYHQMFTGAFMYAGGKHIGIEYGSTGELFGLSPLTTDENGQKTGGKLSGWGIAHEIGHCINAASYQRVEVTNNVFAQLAKTDETSATFRTTYDKVYKAVATGTTGHTGDLAVQLAMYWQLHLAYDDAYTYKLYDTVADQQAGLFYARLESYLRTPSKAPESFTATSGDQLFLQAACAAANKDILDFFRAWGIHPDAATVAYAAQYAKESRKIQYIDDDSRLYRLQGNTGMAAGTTVQASITNATDSRINGNQVKLTLSHTGDAADMLGYEISRNGKMVAFVPATATSYTDIVTTENNKAFTYTVIGIDKLLNETVPVQLPEVKVCHDGAISKDGWTATTNMTSPKDTTVNKDNDDPDAGLTATEDKVSAITAALDNDPNTVYYGTGTGGNRPQVVLDLGGMEQVTALKFTPAPENYTGNATNGTPAAGDLYKYRLFGYKIEVSPDGATWTTVKEGSAYTETASATNPASWVTEDDVISNPDGSYTLYFNKHNADGGLDPFLYTYDAAYVRLTSTTMSAMAIAELDVLGPTSDNVELLPEGFGRLKEDFTSSGETIPAGSILFYGSYKGDPSYNVVLLQDQAGNTINGEQLIFAEVPAKGSLGETSKGRWFYWLESEAQLSALQTVQAHLYRVQDAHAMAGQRLTSTSLTMPVPTEVKDIVITSDEATTVAYQPTAAMVAAAQSLAEAPHPAAQTATDQPGGLYADTGSAETVSAPIHLSSSGKSVTYQIKPADEVALAVQTGFTLTPAVTSIQATPTQVDGLYQSSRYVNGALELYAVARSGSIGSVTLTGTMSGASETCTVTAHSLSWLDSVLGPIHAYNQGGAAGEGPAITASAQLTGGNPGGNTGDDSGDEPDSGSGGSSSKPSTGTATVTGTQATVTATIRNNAATATLSAQAASKLVTNTPKGGEAVVKVDAPTTATQATVTLPSSLASDLAADRAATLTVDTPLAQVSLPTAALTQLGKGAKNIAVSVQSQNGLHTLTIAQDGDALATLTGGVKLRLTAPDKPGTVAVLVNKDGTETILKKSVVTQGAIVVPLAGSATVKLTDNSKTFQDAQTHWAKSSIAFVSSRNLFQGTSASHFSPETSMSRGMLVTVLHRLEDEPAATGGVSFSDVPTGKWYAQGVAWAWANGIVTGEGGGLFAPDRPITRQEMAVMLYRYAAKTGMDTTAKGNSLTTYRDSNTVSDWATQAMTWAVSQGLIGGVRAGELAPKAPATRAQVATILERLIKLM